MPSIESLLEKSNNRFKKSNYRPWNYMDEVRNEKQEPTDNLSSNDKFTNHLKDQDDIDVQKDSSNLILFDNKQIAKNSERENKLESKTTSIETSQIDNGKIPIKSKINSSVRLESTLDNIFRLVGHQKVLFFFTVERCMSRGVFSTGAITGDTLVKVLGTSLKMVKTTIRRLVGKGLIVRDRGKTGRGGFYSFSISAPIRSAFIEYKNLIGDAQVNLTERINQSDSIEIKNKNFNVNQEIYIEKTSLSSEWQSINLEPLSEIGLTFQHLTQIMKQGKLEPQMVQDSIDAFAFDLRENAKSQKIKGTLINYFMGILLKQGVYLPPDNYESPKDRALRLYAEQQLVRAKKSEEIEGKARELAFESWLATLSASEKQALLPIEIAKSPFTSPKISEWKKYFNENIWPQQRAQILQGEQ